MVEHLAALLVMALVCTSLTTIHQVHERLVQPAALDALAQRVALNLIRENAADGRRLQQYQMVGMTFTARLANGKVAVQYGNRTWRYKVSVHSD